ncbi:MAG: hypothetical protein IT377_17210 [Polyangiaceae bacterium]|nr:hypothetical protein [Polyangiaceae bacterium]
MSFIVALMLAGKRCLVLGSSPEAARRAGDLVSADASVTVVAPEPCPELERLAASGRIALERRAFDGGDLDDTWLVVLADRDPALLSELGPRCTLRRILLCAVDQPGHNGFHHVAVARAGAVSVAVSTDGQVPALAKRLRDELERAFAAVDVAGFARRLAELRAATDPELRSRVLGDAVARLRVTVEIDDAG